jgi:hypothetical protein
LLGFAREKNLYYTTEAAALSVSDAGQDYFAFLIIVSVYAGFVLAERVGFDNPETSIYCPIKEIAGNRLNKRWLIIVAPFNHRCHALLLRACFSAF